MEKQKMAQQQRGPIMRYNSIDNGLLSSPHPYAHTSLVPSHYQPSHRLMQVQLRPPLLPLPPTRPQHSSVPLRTSSGRMNAVARKPKSHDSGNNPKTKPKEGTSNKMIQSSRSREDERVVSELVFTLSPHPSSLPLPKFFMRQRAAKLSCKAEAKAGGSSDDLSRVFRLP